MANSRVSKEQSMQDAGKEKQELKETLKKAKSDPSVKDAMKKERQPATTEDLSPIHNTQEIGTSGGDQRASETELNKGGDPGKKLSQRK